MTCNGSYDGNFKYMKKSMTLNFLQALDLTSVYTQVSAE